MKGSVALTIFHFHRDLGSGCGLAARLGPRREPPSRHQGSWADFGPRRHSRGTERPERCRTTDQESARSRPAGGVKGFSAA